MTDTTYNGFTNYETWVVAFWLSNQEGTYRYWREMAEEAKRDAAESRQVKEAIWPAKDAPRYFLAIRLYLELHDRASMGDPGLNTDLVRRALATVDWFQVADRFLYDPPE